MDVQSVMTPKPACCQVNTALKEVAQLMIDNDCGQIPVVDDAGMPIGVVTDRDIAIRVVADGRDSSKCCAKDAMSPSVQTVRCDSPLKDAVCLMEAARVRRVPVVDADGKLCGMFSLADLALAGKDEATAGVVKEVSVPKH
ncbi:CBS domain-containing protein [Luteimonas vadosa]|uniref:CBS domain-containing protein n=1 Tax=Luteimonas vadosa TaxID=1165507 RepID=A0ABP9E718_9GAMM